MITAKKSNNAMDESQYDLFETKEVDDVNGNKVEIPVHIASSSKAWLLIEKGNLLNKITAIDAFISAIETAEIAK